jgi:Glyoxalase-like domain
MTGARKCPRATGTGLLYPAARPVARLASIALDCADPLPLAAFWARLLGGEIAATSDAVVAVRTGRGWLMALRVPGYAAPAWPDGAIPQQIHLDLAVDDLEAAWVAHGQRGIPGVSTRRSRDSGRFGGAALVQLNGLPTAAFDALVERVGETIAHCTRSRTGRRAADAPLLRNAASVRSLATHSCRQPYSLRFGSRLAPRCAFRVREPQVQRGQHEQVQQR